MVDPRAYVDPLIPSLIPVPATQAGVCQTCRSSCTEGFDECRQCSATRSLFGSLPAVLPIALMTSEHPLYDALRGYKGSLDEGARRRHRMTAAALLATFVRNHAACMGEFDFVTAIPSMRRVAVRELIDRITGLSEHYQDVITVRAPWTTRDPSEDRYVATRLARGKRVLVIDDTFTSGSTLFSACHALTSAGAIVVGPIVIGRYVRTDFEPSRQLVDRLRGQPWRPERCLRCGGGVRFITSTLL